MADLIVELYGTRVGVLKGTWRTFDFLPDPKAVAKFGIDSPILSVAIPLTVIPVRSRKERRQNFFRELLPEGRMLTRLAQQGAAGNQKYQKYGGKVSLKRVAQVLAANGDHDSLRRLFKLVVVSVAVGNLDLHAKNLSLLHRPDGTMTLSPAYDVVPQAHQPNDGEVALAVSGEYHHAAITMDHLIAEGRTWELDGAADLAGETLATVLQLASTEIPHKRAYTGLVDDITRFTSSLLAGRSIGASGHR